MPKKNKTLCADDLRHAEYYGMQPVFDELYHRSLEGENFTDLMDLILSRDNILLAYRNIKANGGSYTAGTDNKNISDIGCLPPETVAEKVRFIVTGSQHGYRPKAGKTQRHSETKRKNQTVRYSLYLGQAGTAMYQTGHRANLRSEIQRQQLRLSPEPFRGTRRAENLHHASTHEPALCD